MLTKKRFIVLVLAALLLIVLIRPELLSVGYITGYQGLQTEFNSVYVYDYWYDAYTIGPNPQLTDIYGNAMKASTHEFFDHINFDPDNSMEYTPNLGASQSPVAVDLDYGVKTYGPWAVKIGEETVTKSNNTHSWTETIETYKEFQIDRYRCEWSVDLWLSGDYHEASPKSPNIYRDAQIWIRVTPNRFVYFQDNPDALYFAPAKIQLEQIEWFSYTDDRDKKAKDYDIASLQDIFPEAVGDTPAFFYSRGATPADVETTILSYEGIQLDPHIFRDEYWLRFDLQIFRPNSWYNDPLHVTGWSYQFPSVLLDFEVFVFVVGEWTVKLEKGEVIDLETHEPIVPPPPQLDFWTWLQNLLFGWIGPISPLSWLTLGGYGLIIIAMIVFIFFGPTIIKRWLKLGRK